MPIANLLLVLLFGVSSTDTEDPTSGWAVSKTVRVNNIEFQITAASQTRIPCVGQAHDFRPFLRVRNKSAQPLTFCNTVCFTLRYPGGKTLQWSNKEHEPTKYTVAPGQEWWLSGSYVSLQWTPNGKKLRLYVSDEAGGSWLPGEIQPGSYTWSAEYEGVKSTDPTIPNWVGKVKTETVQFEVLETLAGLQVAPPVHRKHVEFRTVLELKGMGSSEVPQQFQFGLSITNGGKELLAFSFYDHLYVKLRSADGKEFQPDYEEERESSPEPPMFVLPGKTATFLFTAHLNWSEDGKTLTLTYPEADNEWSFEGLTPGKYYLSFHYTNSEPQQAEYPVVWRGKNRSCWVGTVTTHEVEFEFPALPSPRVKSRP